MHNPLCLYFGLYILMSIVEMVALTRIKVQKLRSTPRQRTTNRVLFSLIIDHSGRQTHRHIHSNRLLFLSHRTAHSRYRTTLTHTQVPERSQNLHIFMWVQLQEIFIFVGRPYTESRILSLLPDFAFNWNPTFGWAPMREDPRRVPGLPSNT